MLRIIAGAALALWCLTAGPALAHVGQGHVAGFAQGFAHPLSVSITSSRWSPSDFTPCIWAAAIFGWYRLPLSRP